MLLLRSRWSTRLKILVLRRWVCVAKIIFPFRWRVRYIFYKKSIRYLKFKDIWINIYFDTCRSSGWCSWWAADTCHASTRDGCWKHVLGDVKRYCRQAGNSACFTVINAIGRRARMWRLLWPTRPFPIPGNRKRLCSHININCDPYIKGLKITSNILCMWFREQNPFKSPYLQKVLEYYFPSLQISSNLP